MTSNTFSVEIEQIENFRFDVRFAQGGISIIGDEPPPTGQGSGPQPAELLAAAVANCLMASLFFCLTKARTATGTLKAHAEGRLARDAQGRLRVAGIEVTLAAPAATPRCLTLFENYCVVTESVRAGIPVSVKVIDEHGHILHATPALHAPDPDQPPKSYPD